jgi:sugar/nucleoside kinase (ribokinase family)
MKKVLFVGEINVDLILQGYRDFPVPGKEVLVDDFSMVPGSASAICAMGLARLGSPVAFLGKVGDDPWGRFCLDALRGRGIDVSRVIVDPSLKTGVTVAITSPKDRALVSYLGSIGALRAADVPAVALEGFDHLHVSSYFLQEGLRPGIQGLFRLAHARGLTTSLDPGFDPSESWGRDLADTLGEADLFFPNEVELRGMSGLSDPEEALRAFLRDGLRVVAKLGAEGAMTLEGDRALRVAAFPVKPVDTTGAGDSFDAGFLHAWLGGEPVEACLRLGAACGALSTLGLGGTAAQPTLAEARAFLTSASDPSAGSR